MAEGVAALGHRRALLARHGEEHAPRRAAGDPERMRLGDAGKGAREVLIVADRYRAVEGQHRQGRVLARLRLAFGVFAAAGRLGVAGRRHAERTRQQRRQLRRRRRCRPSRAPCGTWPGCCGRPRAGERLRCRRRTAPWPAPHRRCGLHRRVRRRRGHRGWAPRSTACRWRAVPASTGGRWPSRR